MGDVRFRGRATEISDTVQLLDAFPKMHDVNREEGRTTGAMVTIICALVSIALCISEISSYMSGELVYKFVVDTDLQTSRMHVDVDLTIAMPCNVLDAEVAGALPSDDAEKSSMPFDSPFAMFFAAEQTSRLKLTPTRFELNEEESGYWQMLQDAQRYLHTPGARHLRSLADVNYVQDSVLDGLHSASERKQGDELARLKERGVVPDGGRGGAGGMGHMQIMIGGGVMQVVQFGGGGSPFGGDDSRDDSQACRVHGRVPVRKAKGMVEISAGRKIDMGPFQGRMNIGEERHNFTHRIEHVGFGPRVPGLVVPLAGTQKITEDHKQSYQYFIKIVPTRLRTGFIQTLQTYQYAVTHMKRRISHDEGSHGRPSIRITYELSPMMVDISLGAQHTLINLLTRLCACVGGVIATFTFGMRYLSTLRYLVVGRCTMQPLIKQ